MIITNKKLNEIKGGGISFSTGLIIIAALTFAFGVLEGLVNPIKCNRGKNVFNR